MKSFADKLVKLVKEGKINDVISILAYLDPLHAAQAAILIEREMPHTGLLITALAQQSPPFNEQSYDLPLD